MSRVIVIDWGIFLHRSIFALKNNPNIPATFTAMSMILGNLKRIGANEEDKIIVAIDARGSWRKQLEKEYKGNRKQQREDSGIDFYYWYEKFDVLLQEIDIGTNWWQVKIDHLEADDIMAVACRYYKDEEVILLTYDSDLEQMWEYPNVKIFSPKSKKWKLKPKNFNVYSLLAKKVNKEASDNLVSAVLNEDDYDKRMMCVNLLTLPEWVEKAIIDRFDEFYFPKSYYPEAISSDTIRKRFLEVYKDKTKIISYENQLAKEVKKELKKKAKKVPKGGNKNGS